MVNGELAPHHLLLTTHYSPFAIRYSPFAPLYKWHATSRPSTSPSGGAWREQTSITCGQRGWKWQPGGGRSGEGTSPGSTISSRRSSGLLGSAAENRAAGVGGLGAGKATSAL